MFDSIKEICEAVSCGWANAYLKSVEKDTLKEDELLTFHKNILKKKDQIEKIANECNIKAECVTSQSGSEINGKYIEFMALIQGFEMQVSKLLEIVNILGKSFEIKFTKNKLTISSPKNEQKNAFKTANYFISSNEWYAIDLKSKELVKMKGRKLGGATLIDDDWKFSANIEAVLSLDTIIDEILHTKLPEEIQQQHINIDMISDKLIKKFFGMGYDKILKNSILEEEKEHAICTFQLFDKNLEKIL